MNRYAIRLVAVPDGDMPAIKAIEASDDVAALLRAVAPDDGREHLVAVAIGTRGEVVGYEVIASGTVDACMLYPRDIFAWAVNVPLIRYVGVAHNHPSGEVDLSKPDKVGSAVVAASGKLLGIDLVWSMVFTHRNTKWDVWRPEGRPQEGGEDTQPRRPEMPPEAEPEEGGIEPPEGEEEGNEVEPEDEANYPEAPGHAAPGQDEVQLDAVRAALRRVIGK